MVGTEIVRSTKVKTIEDILLEEGYKKEWDSVIYAHMDYTIEFIKDGSVLPKGRTPESVESIAVLSVREALGNKSVNSNLYNIYILYKNDPISS